MEPFLLSEEEDSLFGLRFELNKSGEGDGGISRTTSSGNCRWPEY